MAKAAQLASAQELLALIERCGLLTGKEASLNEAAAGLDDARNLARKLVAESLLTKWQAAQLLNGFHQFTWGKYRLLDQLGSGSIGREFLAEHVHLGRRVAVKLVSPQLTADAARREQFLADTRRAVALDHPNLVHTHDVDQQGSRYYVVTEFIDGDSLQRRMQTAGAIAPADALALLRQVATGLAHAAKHNVLHGDLRPANVMVDKQGNVKVVDLGFSQLVAAASREAADDGAAFLAPETSAGKSNLDARADMYSLGQILSYLLTAATPVAAAADADERRQALLSRAKASSDVAQLYSDLTAPNPAQRPQSWATVLERLKTLESQQAEEVAAAAPAPVPKKRTPVAKALPAAEAEVPRDDESSSTPVVLSDSEVQSLEDSQPIIVATGDRKSSRGRKTTPPPAKPPAESQAVAEPNAEAATPAKKPLNKKLDPKVVIAVASIAGVLMLAIAGGGLWLLLGGKGKQVAESKPGKTKNEKKGETSATEATEEESNPEEKNPDTMPEDPAPATTPEDPAKPSTTVATAPMATDPAPMKEPDPTPAVPPAENSTPAVPETTPAPPTDPPPATTDPAPTSTAPSTEPMPMGKPFERLPKRVGLPALAAGVGPVVLGDLDIAGEKSLVVTLLGGEAATRTKAKFSLQPANNGTDDKNWEILLSRPAEADVMIAKLHRDKGQLTFEWTPEAAAAANSVSAFLCNCLLDLRAGTSHTQVALRTPVELDSITIDFEKGSKRKIEYEYPPQADSIKVELIGLDPSFFPNSETKEEKAGAVRGTVLWFGDDPQVRVLGLKIDRKDAAKGMDLNLQPFFRPQGQGDAKRITKRLLPDSVGALDLHLKQLTLQSAAIDKGSASNEQKEQAKNLVNVDIKSTQEMLDRVNKAMELIKRGHETATVHVRVVFDTGEGKVVLAQTKGAPEPPPPAAKPEAK